MSNYSSIIFRFKSSLLANSFRAALTALTSIYIAKKLLPFGYGDLMFLLGSFVAIRSLLDMGSSSAFYTLISKKNRSYLFFKTYFIWIIFQFFIAATFIFILIPRHIFDSLWLGHNKLVTFIAFSACFIQQQVWQTMIQIAESMRLSSTIQKLNFLISGVYLLILVSTAFFSSLNIEKVLLILLFSYFFALIIGWNLLKNKLFLTFRKNKETSINRIYIEFYKYCKPLFYLSIISFLYDFLDKWMLQKFGGSQQQGFFQISSQFASICLIATTSILSIYWKEVAHSHHKKQMSHIQNLYLKTTKRLFFFGCFLAGSAIPWTKELIYSFLGPAYSESWLVLSIMFIYPITQSVGQIGGSTLLATANTRKVMQLASITMLISIPMSYFLLAPINFNYLPGMHLGAVGLAIKFVLLGFFSVNLQAYIISNLFKWNFEWKFQFVSIILMVINGYLSKYIALYFLDINSNFFYVIFFYILFYLSLSFLTLTLFPSLAGLEKLKLKKLISEFRSHE